MRAITSLNPLHPFEAVIYSIGRPERCGQCRSKKHVWMLVGFAVIRPR
jgi:hypothetical protein